VHLISTIIFAQVNLKLKVTSVSTLMYMYHREVALLDELLTSLDKIDETKFIISSSYKIVTTSSNLSDEYYNLVEYCNSSAIYIT